jgi:hypothetical protein
LRPTTAYRFGVIPENVDGIVQSLFHPSGRLMKIAI